MRRIAMLLVGVACSCSSTREICDIEGVCTSADGGVVDAPNDTSFDAPQNCDLAKAPKDSPACIDDSVGIFVSALGSDTNPGTKTSPVATVTKALAILGSHPRIYVCDGTYSGSIDVNKSVGIFGGLKCDWTPSSSRPVVNADKTAYAMQVAAPNVSLVDLELNAKPGVAAGESSIGVFANASQNLNLVRVKVTAGVGVKGTDGTTGSNYTAVSQGDVSIRGKDASGITGGGPKPCTLCADNKNSVGGGGGNGGASTVDGQDGTPNLGGSAPNDGKGGFKDTGASCTNGHKGANATGPNPASSPLTTGTLDSTGWKPTKGGDGVNGATGQGGGGGGGGIDGTNLSGGGGGGGCGGCGGAAGTGGTGGGSAIALVSFSSTITLTGCGLITGNAGDGGKGAPGQAGQLGGFSGTQSNPGCPGGTGGTGASGGAGAGGSGGLSVGILYKGTKPTTDSATDAKITFGTKGNKGIGGAPGTNDGIDGVAQAVLQAP